MESLRPHLEFAPLPLGWAVYEPGSTQDHVYFPTDAIISLLYVLADGASTELGVVGNDGPVGVSLFMGGETTPSRAVVQSAGEGYRLPSNELKMTQGLIANMLGVRREGVTEAAGQLQAVGLIRYSRGRIVVIDRPKLEARVCECYAVAKRETDCLFPAKIV